MKTKPFFMIILFQILSFEILAQNRHTLTGFYGTVSGTLSQRNRLCEEIYANLNYRTRKTNTYLILDQGYDAFETYLSDLQYQTEGDTLMRQKSYNLEKNKKYMIATGTGIQFNDNNSLDISYR